MANLLFSLSSESLQINLGFMFIWWQFKKTNKAFYVGLDFVTVKPGICFLKPNWNKYINPCHKDVVLFPTKLSKYYQETFDTVLKRKELTFADYQKRALQTAIYPEGAKVLYPALGLGGECGEVLEKVKKVVRDSNGQFSEEKKVEIAKELGDVCWYLSAICSDLGLGLEDIFKANLDKLESRKERGKLQGSGDNR